MINVLIIDNDQEFVERFKKCLGQAGGQSYEVQATDRLAQGLKILARNDTDILFLSLNLPDYPGIAAFDLASAHEPAVPIIILNERLGNLDSIEAVGEGAQDYLIKDEIELKLLVRTIRHALQRHELQNDLKKYLVELNEAENKFKALLEKNVTS